MERDCEIVRDLIPLYADDAASEESGDFVTEHCRNCDECRKYLDMALYPIACELEENKAEVSGEFLKKLKTQNIKRKKRRKKRIIVSVAAAIVLLLPVAAMCCLGNSMFTSVDYGDASIFSPDAEEKIYSVTLPSAEEVHAAADEVRSYFTWNFGGCILNSLTYNQEESEDGRIVFDSTFYVLFANENEAWDTENRLYEGWSWVVEYNYIYNKWMVTDYGFG